MASKQEILLSYVALSAEGYYTPTYPPYALVLANFLSKLDEPSWTEAKNMLDENIKNINSNGLNLCSLITTLPDGTVWYDSKAENTYQKFLDGTIAPNQNNRGAFMSVLTSPTIIAYETVLQRTGEKLYTVAIRVGPDTIQPLGIYAFSIKLDE